MAPLLPSKKSIMPESTVLKVPNIFPNLFNRAVKRVDKIEKLDDMTDIIPKGIYLAQACSLNNGTCCKFENK